MVNRKLDEDNMVILEDEVVLPNHFYLILSCQTEDGFKKKIS